MLKKAKKSSSRKMVKVVLTLAAAVVMYGSLPLGRAVADEKSELFAVMETVSDALTDAASVASEPAAGEKPAVSDVASAGDRLQSINFVQDATINEALTALGLKYGRNIVPSAKVTGQVAVTTLRDVTFEEAMSAVLGTEYVYEIEGNLIKVLTVEEYAKKMQDPARMEHRVFSLYYLQAAEAEKLVKPLLSTAGAVKSSTAAETGIASGDEVGATPGGDSLGLNDVVIVYDFPENLARIESLISRLDIRPKQVLVEATILSARLNDEMTLGVDFTKLPGNIKISGFATGSLITPSKGLNIGVTSGNNLEAFISALEEITDTNVIANPKTLAVNKQVGTVFIGEKVGYESSKTISEGGNSTSEVKFLDSGTKLSFRPYIGNDGYIRMDIYPKDSSATKDKDGIPTETTAETSTNVIIRDGETIIIGGLFRDTITTSRSQVPVLGNIPFVGALFRKTADTNKRDEIIIALKCHIIDEPSQANGDDRLEDINRKREAARKNLMWITRARLAEDSYVRALKHYTNGDKDAALRELNWTLHLRPTYLEAGRLRERIISHTEQGAQEVTERLMLNIFDKEEAGNWHRK